MIEIAKGILAWFAVKEPSHLTLGVSFDGIPRRTMGQALTISALARSTGVTSKTLRYWERVGLLPKAARTHTGYRIFGAEANHYIEFILKAKSVGLTLSEMKRVLEFGRQGKNGAVD